MNNKIEEFIKKENIGKQELDYLINNLAILNSHIGLYDLLKSVNPGDKILAEDRNAEHQNHINNHNFVALCGQSQNLLEMRETRDPYPSGDPSLAVSGKDELLALRNLIVSISGNEYWYLPPVKSILDIDQKLIDINNQLMNEYKIVNEVLVYDVNHRFILTPVADTQLWNHVPQYGDGDILFEYTYTTTSSSSNMIEIESEAFISKGSFFDAFLIVSEVTTEKVLNYMGYGGGTDTHSMKTLRTTAKFQYEPSETPQTFKFRMSGLTIHTFTYYNQIWNIDDYLFDGRGQSFLRMKECIAPTT